METLHGDASNIYSGIITVSKYFGVFPFRISANNIRPNTFILPICSVLTVTYLYWCYYFWIEHVERLYQVKNQTIASKALITTYLGFAITPLVSNFWLTYKHKTLRRVIEILTKLQKITHHYPKLRNLVIPIIGFSVEIAGHFYGSFFLNNYKNSTILHVLQLIYMLCILIVHQFVLVVQHLQSHYGFILSTVNRENAELWTQCHELLGYSCALISECYSPQLLLYFLSCFVMIVSNAYITVLLVKTGQPYPITAYYLAVCLNLSFAVWNILYNCRDALVKAKNFDKILYRMVINDDTKVLLRNRRIQIHYKGKRNEEFSAMGFFNLDYPLICSMVFSATTYIVILVQFSN